MQTQLTIVSLNSLIQVCRDNEDLCRVGAARVQSTDLGSVLRRRSEEWGRQGDELQALVLLLNGEPATTGSLAAGVQRAWLILRSALLGADDASLIEVWHRSQEQALQRYEEATGGYLPERIRRTISLQADRIADRLDQISVLRGRHAIRSQSA